MVELTVADYAIAQKIAWGPLMFEAARCARDMGVLEVLEKAADAGLTPAEVSERAHVTPYAARVLLEACLSLELVKLEAGSYRLAPPGFVVLHDPMTRVNMNFTHDVCYQGSYYLKESLEQGKPVGLKEYGDWPNVYEGLSQTTPQFKKSWFEFDHFYSDPIFKHALKVVLARKPRHLLDVGGNTGRFALQAAKDVDVTILDLPGQLAVASKNAEAAGLSGRIHPVPLDLLDHGRPFPRPFDAVWMSQFLDCFGEGDIVGLLKRGRQALADDGRLYVVETFWDRQRLPVASYCLHATSLYFTAIANGTSRMYHSDDLLRCAREANLQVEADQPLGLSHTLLTLRPG